MACHFCAFLDRASLCLKRVLRCQNAASIKHFAVPVTLIQQEFTVHGQLLNVHSLCAYMLLKLFVPSSVKVIYL